MRALFIAVLALLALPAAAAATTTVSMPKTHPVIKGDGAADHIEVGLGPGPEFVFVGTVEPGDGCTRDQEVVRCNAERATVTGTLGGGDDRLRLGPPAIGSVWRIVDVRGARGDDRMDASAIPETEPYDGDSNPIFLDGNNGADRLTGSAADDTLSGGPGDDVLRGNAGDDALFAELDRDSAYGGAGDDGVFGTFAEGVYDGGDDDDLVQLSGKSVPVCGQGGDQVAYETPRRAPGVLLGDDCERFYNFAGGHATAVSQRRLTFPVACAEFGRCKATLQIRWNGALVAEQRFRGTGKAAPVRIGIPRALGRAIARKPQLLAMNIDGYKMELGDDDVGFLQAADFYWRVRVSA